jgi:hypothetical protein
MGNKSHVAERHHKNQLIIPTVFQFIVYEANGACTHGNIFNI